MYPSTWSPPPVRSTRISVNGKSVPTNNLLVQKGYRLCENGILNLEIIRESFEYHGNSFKEKLTESLSNHSSMSDYTCELLNLNYEDFDYKKYKKRSSVISKYEELNTEVKDFICEKGPWIFRTSAKPKNQNADFFLNKCYTSLKIYKYLPPLEYYLKAGSEICEQQFYMSVCGGDILFGKVIDYHGDDTHILQIIATGGYNHRDLTGTNIKAELKWNDLMLGDNSHQDHNTFDPSQNVSSSDDINLEQKMWEINTVLTVEVLHTLNIIDGKINPGEMICVGTKGIVLQNLYYNCLYKNRLFKKIKVNKFPLGKIDIENNSNTFPSILKSMTSKELHSYHKSLKELSVNANSKIRYARMSRCLNLQSNFCHSLMNTIHNSSFSWYETDTLRQAQNMMWVKEGCDKKSVYGNKEQMDAVLESLEEVSKKATAMKIEYSDMIIYRANIYKNLSRYKEAIRYLKQLSNYHEMKNIMISEIILEYAIERESTQNFREAEKLYRKSLEMRKDAAKESIIAIERLKELNSEEGKDQDIEELEKLLELREDVKKSVKQLTLQSMSSLEDLLEIGLVQLEDERTKKYNCSVCDICVSGTNVILHLGSKKHKKKIEQMIKATPEDPDYFREDIKEGLRTGLIEVNSDNSRHYDCTACKLTATGIEPLIMHIDSEKHKKKGNVPLMEALAIGDIKWIDVENVYHCEICDTHFITKTNAIQHVMGKKHEKALKKKELGECDDKLPSYLEELFNTGILVKKEPPYGKSFHALCAVCKISTLNSHDMISHLSGKQHKHNVHVQERERKKHVSKKFKCAVWLGSIPQHATEADVIDCISNFGLIRNVRIQLRLNDHAVIEMFEEEDAKALITAHTIEKIKILGQEIEVDFSVHHVLREHKISRVLHLSNLPDRIDYTSLIELVSLYGEVSGVKFLTDNEREGGHKALVEMVDPDAAINLMNNLDKIQKQGQKIIVNYSEHKSLNRCHRPQKKSTISGANTTELANEIKFDHQLPTEQSEKLLQPDYLIHAKREMNKINLSHKPGIKVPSLTSSSTVPIVSKPAAPYNAPFNPQNISPGSSNECMSEAIQQGRIRHNCSTDMTNSLNISSGTVAGIKSFMPSMNGEQRDIWKQRFGDHVSRMEQEIENALADPTTRSTDDNFSTNPEFAQGGKRKIVDNEHAHTNMKDFLSRKTIDHPESRTGSSSSDTGTSYGSKRKKILLDDEDSYDKSGFNLISRGLSIDRTRQEVKEFFSDYGIIKDVHLEWSKNPTFVGEQTAYIAFEKTDDAISLLNQSQNLSIKDSLISIKMHTDSSKTNSAVILVGGITQIFNDSKRELFYYFNMFGSVKTVLLNTKSRNSHYAFVVFNSKEDAKKIVSSKEQYIFYKDILTLKETKVFQDEKKLEKLEITQKAVTVPSDKFNPMIKQSVNILKEIMTETEATYEFVLNPRTSINQTLIISGTPEQIFSAKKLINENLRMQQNKRLTEKESEKDLPKILIITEKNYEVLENICLEEVDLELDTCVRVLENMTLQRLYNSVSLILNELISVKYVIFVFGIQDLTNNVNTSKGWFNVPKEDFVVINDFLEHSQDVSERLRNKFRGVKFYWTTPSPYSFEKYNNQNMSNDRYARSQLIPRECWRSIQSNFHKCLINLRMKMLQSDPHYTVDFLKLFLYSDNSNDDLSGEGILLKGEVSKDFWFKDDCNVKLNTEGGRALRYCIRKAVQRQILWGSDSEGKSEWFDYVRDMLDKEQQERYYFHRDLQPIIIPNIEEILQIYGSPVESAHGSKIVAPIWR